MMPDRPLSHPMNNLIHILTQARAIQDQQNTSYSNSREIEYRENLETVRKHIIPQLRQAGLDGDEDLACVIIYTIGTLSDDGEDRISDAISALEVVLDALEKRGVDLGSLAADLHVPSRHLPTKPS